MSTMHHRGDCLLVLPQLSLRNSELNGQERGEQVRFLSRQLQGSAIRENDVDFFSFVDVRAIASTAQSVPLS